MLVEPDYDSDGEDESPQVFLITGWGEPGSEITQSEDEQQRREWKCWVAAHRVKAQPGKGGEGAKHLIIVEFELEQDIFNPLYPPTSSSEGSASPPSGSSDTAASGSGSSTNNTPENCKIMRATSTPILTSTSISSDGNTPKANTGSPAYPQLSTLDVGRLTLSGLEGDDTWTPSAEAILESTTSRSRPLRALERMRRFSRSDGSSRPTHNIGTMDVFTVLTQINEQLRKALDLTQLFETVVGIIKDLTQFHRVLVYQFDEAWNGQVRSRTAASRKRRQMY